MKKSKQFLFDSSVSRLNKIGLLSENSMSNINYFISGVSLIFLWYDLMVPFIQYSNVEKNVEDQVKNFEGVGAFIQMGCKWITCLYCKQKFLNLIEISNKHFWDTNKCSKKVPIYITASKRRISLFQTIFLSAALLAVSIKIALGILQKQLVIGSWRMNNNTVLFYFTWITMMIHAELITIFVVGFDCIFLGFCCEIIFQFKILFNQVEQLSVTAISEELDLKFYIKNLKIYIMQHQVLLRCYKEMQSIYSVTFLIQYLTASPLICGQMFAAFQAVTLKSKISYIYYVLFLMAQLAFYCVPVELITDEMATMSDAVYNSHWYSSQHITNVRTPLILLMQRAQQDTKMMACGLIEMNIDTLVKVIKFSVTTCLALQELRK